MKGKQTINRKIHCPKKVDPSLQKTNIGEQPRGRAGDVKGTGAPSGHLKHKTNNSAIALLLVVFYKVDSEDDLEESGKDWVHHSKTIRFQLTYSNIRAISNSI